MDDAGVIRAHGDGVTLTLHILPRAGRDEVAGLAGGALRVRLKAPPLDGRANEALLTFLADRLGVPRSALSIVAGAGSRRKVVYVAGVTVEAASARLLAP